MRGPHSPSISTTSAILAEAGDQAVDHGREPLKEGLGVETEPSMTSAPWSTRIRVVNGPETTRIRSSTGSRSAVPSGLTPLLTAALRPDWDDGRRGPNPDPRPHITDPSARHEVSNWRPSVGLQYGVMTPSSNRGTLAFVMQPRRGGVAANSASVGDMSFDVGGGGASCPVRQSRCREREEAEMERFEVDGGALEFQVRGEGPPLVLVHGSVFADPWEPMLRHA